MPHQIAKIFMNGRSQAVRLPKEYHFITDEVYITKQGDNVIISEKDQLGMIFLIPNRTSVTIF